MVESSALFQLETWSVLLRIPRCTNKSLRNWQLAEEHALHAASKVVYRSIISMHAEVADIPEPHRKERVVSTAFGSV